MNSFTLQSMQWSALRLSILIIAFLSTQVIHAQCNLDCPPPDTVYNLSFDAATCQAVIDYEDFDIDTTGCGTDYVILLTDTSSQDTLVFGKSDTVAYFYTRDSLSLKFYVEGETDTCRGTVVICDTVPPTVSVQDTFVYDIPGDSCTADIAMPTDTISDNCGDSTLTIFVPGIDTLVSGSAYTLNDVPPGTYPVFYEVTDSCTAPVRDTMILEVNRDNETPDIACDSDITFPANSLPLPVDATVFIETASDDCATQLYYKVRKMNDPTDPECSNPGNPNNMFDDVVQLCCENIPTDTVIVRVYDKNPGPGPVSEDTLDGHYSTCMVEYIVQDKDTPTLEAPTDLSIACGTSFDSTDLSPYGDIAFSPMERDTFTVNGQQVIDGIVDDNCPENISVIEAVEIDTNMCGLGEIRRIFTAVDSGGNTAIDTQTISIEQEEMFDEDNIIWPPDTTLYNCSPFPDPDITGHPALDTLECTLLGYHYQDKIFDITQGCYKILRQWVVIDWCQNDPNVQDEDWKFMHEQIIKINDTTAPQFPVLDTITVEHMDPNCEPVFVAVPDAEANDCSFYPPLDYTVSIDYGDDGTVDTTFSGNDASGEYPNGTHRVTYTAEDDCGNTGQAERIIEVRDEKPPTGAATNLVSVNMSLMNGIPMVMVPASIFNPSDNSMNDLQDNCTSGDDLRFSYSSDVNDDELIVDCDDIGDTTLTIYVWDEAGNSASVLTNLRVTDQDSLCPQTTSGSTISGQVMVSGVQQPMPGVEVHLTDNGNNWKETTNTEGEYAFQNMTVGNHYTIQPAYDEDYLNGVSTYDLVLIQRHILGIKNFGDPYLYISADVNNDSKVSATDMVDLRKVILGQSDAFTNNHSWRFIPSAYQMTMSPGKPIPDFPEETSIELKKDGSFVPFTAVKVGDINGSMDMDGWTSVEDRDAHPLFFEYRDEKVRGGEVIDLPFYLSKTVSLCGFQGAIDIDPQYAELVYAQSDALPDFSPHSVAHTETSGETRFSWNQAIPVKCGQGEPIMLWKLRVKKDCHLKDIIEMNKASISNEVYDGNQDLRPLELQLREEQAGNTQTLQFDKVYPNPFEDVTNVLFNAAKEGSFTFRIIDAFGKEVFSKEYAFNQGSNHLQVNLKDLSISGLLYYQLECDKQVITGKLIKATR